MSVHAVDTDEAARALAASLHDPDRRRIIVLITMPAGASAALIDSREVADAVGDLADVYVMPNGEPSWAFADGMPPGTQVYGGAGRVYPLGLDWVDDLRRSPIRFVWTPGDAPVATARLIGDALAAAAGAGLASVRRHGASSVVTATILGTPTASQALVRLDNGSPGVLRTGAAFPGITADRIVTAGMQVQGDWYPEDRTLDVSQHVPNPQTRLDDLTLGDWFPVLVSAVAEDNCELVVVPGLRISLPASEVTGDADDDLRDLLSEAEVVLARFTGDGEHPVALLGHPDDREPRPALSVWPGGPPWLLADPEPSVTDTSTTQSDLARTYPPGQAREQTPRPSLVPPSDAPASPPRPTPRLLDRSRTARDRAEQLSQPQADRNTDHVPAAAASASGPGEVSMLRGQLARMELEREGLLQQLSTRDNEIRRLRALNRKASSRRSTDAENGTPGFTDPHEQFQWDVQRAWVERIPAGEKPRRPLSPYTVGPNFLTSIDQLQGVSRDKIVDVVVEILTGIADVSAGRQMHQLRSGAGANDPVVVDGSRTAWRVNLQTNTPSARRLHFWRGPVGFELSRVAAHDDMEP